MTQYLPVKVNGMMFYFAAETGGYIAYSGYLFDSSSFSYTPYRFIVNNDNQSTDYGKVGGLRAI